MPSLADVEVSVVEPRSKEELVEAFGRDAVAAAATSLGLRNADLEVPAEGGEKETRVLHERRTNALRALEDKVLQLVGREEEVSRWNSVRGAPPPSRMRDTSTQLLRPQSAPNLGASAIRDRNARSKEKFRQQADHKVCSLLDSLLTSKRAADAGEERVQASASRLKATKESQARHFEARANENTKAREKVFSRVRDHDESAQEARDEYGRQHDARMARVEQNRLAYQANEIAKRKQLGQAKDLQVEKHYQENRRRAKKMAQQMEEKSQMVEEYKEATRQKFAARKKAWQAQYQSRMRNADEYQAVAQQRREENHLHFDEGFSKTRENHANLLENRKAFFKDHNAKRKTAYERTKARLDDVKAATNDALFERQKRAKEHADYIRGLGLKSGVPLSVHNAERELWEGITGNNLTRLRRQQHNKDERILRIVEERMAAASAVKEEMSSMANERAKLSNRFLKMQDEFDKVFSRLKATKDPEKLKAAVEELGYTVDLSAYGFEVQEKPKAGEQHEDGGHGRPP